MVPHITQLVLTQINPNLAVRVKVRLGLRLGLVKSWFPVGRAKDQSLPAGPIATALCEWESAVSIDLHVWSDHDAYV